MLRLILLTAAGCMAVAAQPSAPGRREVREDGWALPKILGLKPSDSRIADLEGVDVTVRSFNTEKTKPLTPTLIRETAQCEFNWVTTYSIEKRVFAVDGQCVMVEVTSFRSNGKIHWNRDYLSGVTRYTFYDENGDGKFEARYNDTKLKIWLPRWLKRNDR